MLQIRKKVSLDFLGDDYKDGYLSFNAIPIKDFENLQDQIESIGDDGKKSISFIQATLKKYFISGKAPNEGGQLEDVTTNDLDNLDQESVLKCFQALTGQEVNEDNSFLDKDSKTPSSTAEENPSSS